MSFEHDVPEVDKPRRTRTSTSLKYLILSQYPPVRMADVSRARTTSCCRKGSNFTTQPRNPQERVASFTTLMNGSRAFKNQGKTIHFLIPSRGGSLIVPIWILTWLANWLSFWVIWLALSLWTLERVWSGCVYWNLFYSIEPLRASNYHKIGFPQQ